MKKIVQLTFCAIFPLMIFAPNVLGNTISNIGVPTPTPNPIPTGCPYAVQQALIPPAPQCGFNKFSIPERIEDLNHHYNSYKVANGCAATNTNEGAELTKSVVAMYFPRAVDAAGKPGYWSISCTGTIIDKQWVLTAAHCVAGADPHSGGFYPEEATIPLYVAPWQEKFSGVPTRIYESTPTIKYKVKAIYIDAHYNYFGEKWPESFPYPGYLKADFALLKLENPLPDSYKVIGILDRVPDPEAKVWIAGYGTNQNQAVTGTLNYRNMYYMTNKYPGNEGAQDNYGEVYTLGTLPEAYESYSAAAWKFSGNGDSGGATFYYDPILRSFSILGTLTGGIYCNWAGFFAPLPYPYMANASMPYYRNFIYSIIDGYAKPDSVRCISPSGGC